MTVIYLFNAMGPDNSSQNGDFDKFIFIVASQMLVRPLVAPQWSSRPL